MASNIKLNNFQRQSLVPTYRIQTVKAIFQGFPGELASFWVIRKNQKSGKENREKSRASTVNRELKTTACANIAPTKSDNDALRGLEDYGLKCA